MPLVLSQPERRALADFLSAYRIEADGAPRRPYMVDRETWRALLAAELEEVDIGTLAAISDWYGASWMDRVRHATPPLERRLPAAEHRDHLTFARSQR